MICLALAGKFITITVVKVYSISSMNFSSELVKMENEKDLRNDTFSSFGF